MLIGSLFLLYEDVKTKYMRKARPKFNDHLALYARVGVASTILAMLLASVTLGLIGTFELDSALVASVLVEILGASCSTVFLLGLAEPLVVPRIARRLPTGRFCGRHRPGRLLALRRPRVFVRRAEYRQSLGMPHVAGFTYSQRWTTGPSWIRWQTDEVIDVELPQTEATARRRLLLMRWQLQLSL